MRWKICWLAPPSASSNNTIVTNRPENAVFLGFCLYWVIRKEPPMFEQQYILNKIEQWADRLPYQSLKIEVELSNQTLTLEKTKQRPIGFQAPPTEGR
nr:MAG TPA: hypothetical protein [Caudoviricetes sp.]